MIKKITFIVITVFFIVLILKPAAIYSQDQDVPVYVPQEGTRIPKPAPPPPPPAPPPPPPPPPPPLPVCVYCSDYDPLRDEVEVGKQFDPPRQPTIPKIKVEERYFSPGGNFVSVEQPYNYDRVKRQIKESEDDLQWYDAMSNAWR